MPRALEHLGPFSDVLGFAEERARLYSNAGGKVLTVNEVRELLGVVDGGRPLGPRTESSWERDGVVGEEVSWSVGYGPRTHAWLLRPAAASGPLPGVLALHDHAGYKFFGKEKVADGQGGPEPLLQSFRRESYGGRAFANELAKRGFTVLVPDLFLWGSRRFEMEVMMKAVSAQLAQLAPGWDGQSAFAEPPSARDVENYNNAAMLHEHVVAKYCALMGVTFAGLAAYEDRVALAYLRSRADLFAGPVGAIGWSGGGCRTALLRATTGNLDAAVIVCMMSTYRHLLDHNVSGHTWMLFPDGLPLHCDWPDLVGFRAPAKLLVQFAVQDELFPLEGMRAADERIAAQYRAAAEPGSYVAQFYDGPHRFGTEMQEAAFAQLGSWLA